MKTKKISLSIENVADMDFIVLTVGDHQILVSEGQALDLAEALLELRDRVQLANEQPTKAAPALRVVGGGRGVH